MKTIKYLYYWTEYKRSAAAEEETGSILSDHNGSAQQSVALEAFVSFEQSRSNIQIWRSTIL